MNYHSVFDIIGPVMVGPSSSHTAGALRIGLLAREIFGAQPEYIGIHLYGSFAKSCKGHATDVALVGGVLGFATDDSRVQHAIAYAEEQNITVEFFLEEAATEHPNTVRLILKNQEESMSVVGVSIGGGAVTIKEINGMTVKWTGSNPTLLVLHKDAYGAIADVTAVLRNERINIGHMEVNRMEKGAMAIMTIETDKAVSIEAINEIKQRENIERIIVLGQ